MKWLGEIEPQVEQLAPESSPQQIDLLKTIKNYCGQLFEEITEPLKNETIYLQIVF